MRRTLLAGLALLVLATGGPRPACGGVHPYVRGAYGGGRFEMKDVDNALASVGNELTTEGLPTTFTRVGSGYGPSLGAGVWLGRYLRVGGTYSYQRSINDNAAFDFGFLYRDLSTFRMTEYGADVALRDPNLGGITVGGALTLAHGEYDQRTWLYNSHGVDIERTYGKRDQPGYRVYVGIEQTAENGSDGFIHVGYAQRDLGKMDGTYDVNDNGARTSTAVKTPGLDFSGTYVEVGIGFTFGH